MPEQDSVLGQCGNKSAKKSLALAIAAAEMKELNKTCWRERLKFKDDINNDSLLSEGAKDKSIAE